MSKLSVLNLHSKLVFFKDLEIYQQIILNFVYKHKKYKNVLVRL